MRSLKDVAVRAGMLSLGLLCVVAVALPGTPGEAMAQPAIFPGGGGYAGTAGQPTALVTVGEAIIGSAGGAGPTVQAGFLTALSSGGTSGTILTTSVNAGSPASIAVELTGFDPPPTATLHYRMGGDVSFTDVVMTPPGGGGAQWTGAIPAAALTMRGVQFYVTATNGTNSLTLPPGAPGSALADLAVVLTNEPLFSLTGMAYALRSVPMTATNPAPASVFDELGGYDASQWRYGTYDPVNSRYLEPPTAASATPGQGFWIISRQNISIRASGYSTRLDQPTAITLNPGFNQIGCPFGFAVPFDASGVTLPPGTDNNLIGWDGTAYVNGQTALQPGAGYWINYGGAAPADMLIHPDGTPIKRLAAAAPGSLLGADESGWDVTVSAQAGSFRDVDNRFGQRAGATDGRDAYDFMDAPPPPEGYVTLSLLSRDGARLLNDYRSDDAAGKSWLLSLDSDQVDTQFQVSFALERPLPAGWKLLAVNTGTLDETDLLATREIRGRNGPERSTRLWRIAAGPDAYVAQVKGEVVEEFNQTIVAFGLRPAFPNPFRGGSGTVITLAAPREAQASVRVYDLRGRVVKTLHSGAVVRGLQRFTWYGRDDANQRVAAGMYLVRLNAPDTEIVQKVLLLR